MAQYLCNVLLAVTVLAVVWRAYGQEDDFNLEDALDFGPTEKPKPKPPKPPTRNTDDLDLSDFFDTPVKTTTKPPRTITKSPPKKSGDDFDLSDFFDTPAKTTTKAPRTITKAPPKKADDFFDLFHTTTTKKPRTIKSPPKRKPDPGDFDLYDALDENNDRKNNGGGDFSDSDLEDAMNDGYNPDKKKGGRGGAGGRNGNADPNSGNPAEAGTIAGIASALAMALVGAVTSYISYQQKKFCFSIQEGLNAEYVKGEQMEGVVTEEPQVKYSTLETQTSAPPTEDPSKV
ncbi:CD99 antigen-like protein 2 isoform 2-T2 [Discoglossus pictus]